MPIVPISSPMKPDSMVFGTLALEDSTARILTPISAIRNISVEPILTAIRAMGIIAKIIKT